MVSVIVSAGRTDKYSTLRLLSVQIHTDIRTLRLVPYCIRNYAT